MILLNLVYGQDLGHGLFICGSWLWYLANDMQYYIIFLALLFVYAKYVSLSMFHFHVNGISEFGL